MKKLVYLFVGIFWYIYGFTVYCTLQVEYKSPNMERLGLKIALSTVSKEVSVAEVVTDVSRAIIAMLG